MTSLQPFEFEGHDVRVVEIDGDAWFVAADVARLLEYLKASIMVRNLEEDEKGVRPMYTLGGEQQVGVISEGGLFKLIVQRQTGRMTDELMAQKVKRFQRWVTHDVLPSIRKTGGYQVEAPEAPQPRELSRLELIDLARESEIGRLQAERHLEAAKPAVDYVSRYVIEDGDVLTLDNFASQFNSTGPQVRELLRSKGVAVRKLIGHRFSESKQWKVPEYEWRPSQGKSSSEWFVLRPHHKVQRHVNGQVRQTLYVKQYYAEKLAERLGIIDGYQPQLQAVS